MSFKLGVVAFIPGDEEGYYIGNLTQILSVSLMCIILSRRTAKGWMKNTFTRLLFANCILTLIRDLSRINFPLLRAVFNDNRRVGLLAFFKTLEAMGLFGNMGSALLMTAMFTMSTFNAMKRPTPIKIPNWAIWGFMFFSSALLGILILVDEAFIELPGYVLAVVVNNPAIADSVYIVFVSIYNLVSIICFIINFWGRGVRLEGSTIHLYRDLFTWMPLAMFLFNLPFNTALLFAVLLSQQVVIKLLVAGILLGGGESIVNFFLFAKFDYEMMIHETVGSATSKKSAQEARSHEHIRAPVAS
jgi:hypothetical protein